MLWYLFCYLGLNAKGIFLNQLADLQRPIAEPLMFLFTLMHLPKSLIKPLCSFWIVALCRNHSYTKYLPTMIMHFIVGLCLEAQ
jgi:hypothetical protein